MTAVAVSGPTDITNEQARQVMTELRERLEPGDEIVSGVAYGVDTAGAIYALSAGHPLIATVPIDLWHNEEIAALAERRLEVHGSYMDRNDATAEEADELVAFPPTAKEEVRSGVWATVRRFRARDKVVHIVPLSG